MPAFASEQLPVNQHRLSSGEPAPSRQLPEGLWKQTAHGEMNGVFTVPVSQRQ